ERGLVALEGEQVIGLVSNDLVGNLDLATHGVDGDERALKLFGLGELIEKIGDGGDLVGLLRNAQLRQSQPCMGGVGAERMQGFMDDLRAATGATSKARNTRCCRARRTSRST